MFQFNCAQLPRKESNSDWKVSVDFVIKFKKKIKKNLCSHLVFVSDKKKKIGVDENY